MTRSVIELKDIELSYCHKKIFNKINFTVYAGQRVGLMGPNGAGKSSLLRLIMGLTKPDSGSVIIFNKQRQSEDDFYEVRKKLGFSFQDPDDQLFCSTVAEDIAFGPLNLGYSRKEVEKIVAQQISLLGLNGIKDRIIYHLSGGEKRLTALAGVLAMSPQILLLDEPTGDLDRKNIEKLITILKELKHMYLIISHDSHFLKSLCTEIYWLEEGRFEMIS
jgi:cobalt/nickel transport system ATP-binding protein